MKSLLRRNNEELFAFSMRSLLLVDMCLYEGRGDEWDISLTMVLLLFMLVEWCLRFDIGEKRCFVCKGD